ncbi:uncharacterized protein N7500_008544 [Penicillium coprophilum]|uniref:uncharacterized protein n=1 Tax=Penicillium coprophilum TaxID=36646 RepID=UPI002388F3A5|nr:uncharacterized protein N7500_008544 [Penicillium coprophilum]KAJ5158893.1 hypothetical protein N7500_008544 [Penicillium coprophilum]
MRHYTLIPPDLKKEDNLLAKPSRVKPDQRAIYEMAELTYYLGFKSTEIDRSRGRLCYRPENRIGIDITTSSSISYQPDRSQDLLVDSTVKIKVRSRTIYTRKLRLPILSLAFLSAAISILYFSESLYKTRDKDILDQSSPRDKNLSLREIDLEPAPNNLVLAPLYDSHNYTSPRDIDTVSDCTRISFEVDKSRQDPDKGVLIVPASLESEADSSPNISGPPRQQALDIYLTYL